MIMLLASADAIAAVMSRLPETVLSDASAAVTVTTPLPPLNASLPSSSIVPAAEPLFV